LRALNHTADEFAVDELALEAGGVAQAQQGEAVEFAMGALAGLVEKRDGVTREQLAVAAGQAQAVAQVLGGVVESDWGDVHARVQARQERLVEAGGQAGLKLGEADEDDGEQGPAVPVVVEQDVEVAEHVGVEQVRLVEEEDGVDAAGGELMHVRGDSVEHGGRGGLRLQPERQAQLPVEVAAAERRVVAVRQAEALLGEAMAQGAQDARLADARLAGDQDGLARLEGVDDVGDDGLFRGGEPELGVGYLLREGQVVEAEGGEECVLPAGVRDASLLAG